MRYYFVVKEKNLGDRIALLLLASYRDLNFELHYHWHEASITHPQSERFNDLKEAEGIAEQFSGEVKSIPIKIYDWLVEMRKLDEGN